MPMTSRKFSAVHDYINHARHDASHDVLDTVDVLTNASMGEGFGLATIEAQACGTPVVVTNCSASKELVGAGWKVGGIKFWANPHRAFWLLADPDELNRAYESAYDKAAKMRQTAAGFARKYDVDKIVAEYWLPVLPKLVNDAD